MEDIYDRCQVLILDAEDLEADERAVEIVENYMEEDIDLVLAVGAGTIHDLSRFVAHQYRIPFVSVPTAASSDGFTSTVADMTWNGVKKAVAASAPLFVFADTDIFAKAPKRLTAAGVSDILGKYIALADWKIASILSKEYYCAEVVNLETKAVRTVKDNLKEIAAGEEEACEKLMYALVLSGLAMQMTGNSRPASGAEHHLVHLWDMEVVKKFLQEPCWYFWSTRKLRMPSEKETAKCIPVQRKTGNFSRVLLEKKEFLEQSKKKIRRNFWMM